MMEAKMTITGPDQHNTVTTGGEQPHQRRGPCARSMRSLERGVEATGLLSSATHRSAMR